MKIKIEKHIRALFQRCYNLVKRILVKGLLLDETSNKKKTIIIDELSIVATLGFRLSDYLEDKGITRFSIYTEKSSFLLFKVCLSQLLPSEKVRIENYYNNDGHQYQLSNQWDFQLQRFQKLSFEKYDANLPLLLAMEKIPKKMLNELEIHKINYISLPEIMPDLLRYASLFKPVELFYKKHPNLNIVLHNYPKILDFTSASEYERRHMKRSGAERHKIHSGLKQNPPVLNSESLAQFNYDINEIYPFLSGYEQLMIDENGIISGKDYVSKYVNFSAGHRITVGQPTQYERTIWHFGFSQIWGIGAPDYGTIASFLQANFNCEKQKIRLENYGYSGISRNIVAVMKKVNAMAQYFKDGDIILIETRGNLYNDAFKPKCHILNIENLFSRPHNYGEVFIDTTHLNELGNKVVADKIFDFISEQGLLETTARNTLTVNDEMPKDKQNDTDLSSNKHEDLKDYLLGIKELRPRIGSIVMNCNPFTLGHRYLIEYAAAKCSQLFIFVVEEDRSFFSFSDRIDLVRKGTKDISNVKVIPSGEFIISSTTFIDYFGKSEIQDQTIDPTMDLELFGKYIAPTLGINIRFAGEEPLDAITQQYNDAMLRILPQYSVQFEVIPRKEIGGAVISASRVRELLDRKEFLAIKELVPLTTFEWLVSKFS